MFACMIRTIAVPGSVFALLAAWSTAQAVPVVTGIGDFDRVWTISAVAPDNQIVASGAVYWDVFDDGGTLYFGFSIVNTSPSQGSGTTIVGFAWDAPSGVTMSNGSSSLNWGFGFGSQTLPGEPGVFDACTFGGQNCGAGSNAGIDVGDGFNWFFVELTSGLDAADLGSAFADSDACLRFGSGRGNVACVANAESAGEVGALPEPDTLVLFGLGLLGLGLRRRRR